MKNWILLDKYERIVSNGKYVPEIDGLRFIAISTVFLLHFNTNYKRIFINSIPTWYNNSLLDSIFLNSGWGVELFFAISGFIISVPFIKQYQYNGEKVIIKKYLMRRLTRLEPPFFISLTLIYIFNLLATNYTFIDSIFHFLATLTYSHMIVFGKWSSINPVSWSLETEVQFYILAPLFALVFKIKRYLYLFILLLLFFISINLGSNEIISFYHLHKSIITSLHWFLIGIFVADIYIRYPDWFTRKSIYADIISWLGIPFIYISKIYLTNIFFDLVLLVFFISVFKSISFKLFLCNRLVTIIGGMCYTIYLLHYALIYTIMKLSSELYIGNIYFHFLITLVTIIIIILILSFIFFRYLERPFMDKNWFRKKKFYFTKTK